MEVDVEVDEPRCGFEVVGAGPPAAPEMLPALECIYALSVYGSPATLVGVKLDTPFWRASGRAS